MTKPKAILSLLDEDNKSILLQRLQTIYSGEQANSYEQTFNQIEQQLQAMYCLKFLTHRQHHVYIREDLNYQNLQFDENGYIQYKKIFV